MFDIDVDHLSKIYPVAIKQPGIAGTIQHFFKRQYQAIKAVDDVSFQIAPGEIVGFLGANGAGKTTTLKMLTGLIHPSQGKVTVAGHLPFQRHPKFLQKISLVMGQKQQLIWDLPALDSLRINAAVYKIPDRQFRQRLDELSAMLSLEKQLTQPVRKLSLGERMKAELLAALLHHPKILFLDEPTLGLDVNAQASVRQFLQAYNQEYQATLLLTSHYMADITALCKRVLLIHRGRLIYDGALDGLLEKFAPYREVKVELSQAYDPLKLEAFGKIKSIIGQEVRFLIPREKLTATIAQLLGQLDILDLNVTDPPIDEIIGQLFESGLI
jgi:ABC-2 type transport system ATP-binding protein